MKSKGFSYCAVCRRNHDQGRGHRYTAAHRNALQNALAKIRAKIQIVRAFLENPRAPAPPMDRFWCLFCEEDVVVAADDEESSFPCSHAIHHLSSPVHFANVKRFWFENGADANTRHDFLFSDEDVANWEALCSDATLTNSAADADDDEDGSMANNIHHNAARSSQSLRVCVEPLPKFAKHQTLQVSAHNGAPTAAQRRHTVAAFGGDLATAAPPRQAVSSEGNVHSGGPPPWLSDFPAQGGGAADGCPEGGISKRKRRENERLGKRVGAAWANRRRAELELEQREGNVAATPQRDWLPSFGRVWQNGSRRDSRREFEMETKRVEAATPAAQPYGRLDTAVEIGDGKPG